MTARRPKASADEVPIRLAPQRGANTKLTAPADQRLHDHRMRKQPEDNSALAALVALIGRLEQENRVLAEQVGYLRACLDEARRAPSRRTHPASPPTMLPGLDVLARVPARSLGRWLGRRWQHVRPWPRLARSASLVLLPSLVLFLLLSPTLQTFRVAGDSMEPTLRTDQLLLVNKAAYWQRGNNGFALSGPNRGDLAVFRTPNSGGAVLIKRIIGLPGDTVAVRAGVLFLDGERVDEPYVAFREPYTYPENGQPVRVPEGAYFVLGDNRPASVDSHLGWFVPAEDLVGRAWLSYWPPAHWGILPEQRIVARPAPAEPALPEAAATSLSPDGEPSQAPSGPAARLTTLLDERFTDIRIGWPHDPTSTAWFADGSYHLRPRQPGRFVAVGVPLAEAVRDTVVSATLRKVGGPPGGGYGLIVRDAGPGPRDGMNQGGRYYVLEAGDKGEVGIWRREGDRWIDILPWVRSDAVRPGTEANQLEVRAVGDLLTLTINGITVASETDGAVTRGGVGVFVGGDGNEAALERLVVQGTTYR